MTIKEQVQQLEQSMIRDLADLVSFNSVQGEAEPDAPFGKVPAACLDRALQIAEPGQVNAGVQQKRCVLVCMNQGGDTSHSGK